MLIRIHYKYLSITIIYVFNSQIIVFEIGDIVIAQKSYMIRNLLPCTSRALSRPFQGVPVADMIRERNFQLALDRTRYILRREHDLYRLFRDTE